MVRRVSTEVVSPIVGLQHKGDHGITDTLRDQANRHSTNWRQNTVDRHLKPDTLCHCERKVVASTWQRIFDGAGESCGRPDCQPKGTP